jgi:asparagine synthase (glutamine-hydrolysing)
MCGIVGVVRHRSTDVAWDAAEVLRRMAGAMVHRGPDGYGEHLSDNVAIAMRRLSIIDVSGGKQPLYGEDGSVALVANGEIYNHRQLRSELEGLGHRFRSHSDCETIVHAYEQFGESCVTRLRGMFAFAIHDPRRRRLVLARDRLGEKPLYLARVPGALIFSSELRSLLASGLVPVTFDKSSLYTYFHYGYVPEPHTAIAGVSKLSAGHLLSISTDDGTESLTRFWSIHESQPRRATVEEVSELVEDISTFITDADVPVGISLSGGLDSGSLAVLAARKTTKQLHAFTVGYKEAAASDETADARRIAEHAGVAFHPLTLKAEDVIAGFAETVWLKDDPNNDPAGPGYLAVMRAARQEGVPVILVGQGSDELFWGYPWLVEAARRSRARIGGVRDVASCWLSILASRHAGTKPLVKRWINRLRTFVGHDWRKILSDATSPRATRPLFYDTLHAFQTAHDGRDFFSASLLAEVDTNRPFELLERSEIGAADPEAALIQMICDTYLRENGLTQTDRLSMSASIEARVPFVDYKLAELAYGHQRACGSEIAENKRLLRDSFGTMVPHWLLSQPKRGFVPPIALWYSGIYARYARLVEDGVLVSSGVLSGETGRRIARGVAGGRRQHPLYRDAVILELWCRQIEAGRPLAFGD